MRAATLINPVIAFERHLISRTQRVGRTDREPFAIDREALIRSVEITDEEILDDLLYPAGDRIDRR